MNTSATLPQLLRRNAANIGARTAMREKRRGIWHELTWAQHADVAIRFAAGLAARGFKRGDRLAVIGDNSPLLYASLLAAQALGGIGIALRPDAEADRVAYLLRDAGVSVVVAADDMLDHLEGTETRLVVRLGRRSDEQAADIATFDELMGAGTGAVNAAIAQGKPEDIALRLYGIADEGGADVSHAELLAAADTLATSADVHESDDVVAWLPMAWLGDMLGSLALPLLTGCTCNCPEGHETAQEDVREIGPTVMLAPPVVWQEMLANIDARATETRGLKRLLLRACRNAAERSGSRISVAIGEALVFAPLRDQLGLRRLRAAFSIGDALPPNVLRALRGIGVALADDAGCADTTAIRLEPGASLAASAVSNA
jgi:long-chain acyl-CoA synthetase